MKKLVRVLLTGVLFVSFAFSCAAAQTLPETTKYQSTEDIVIEAVENLAAYATTDSSIELRWDEVKFADGYNVYRLNEKTGKYKLVGTVDENSFVVSGLSPGSKYTFKVRALRVDGGQVRLGEKSKTALVAVTAPKKIASVRSEEIGEDYITLSWSASKGASAYEVWLFNRQTDQFTLFGITQNEQMTVDGLKSDSIYGFRVRACKSEENAVAYGEFSYFDEYTDTKELPYTKAQAAKLYNDSINAAKTAENMTVSYHKKVETETESCSKYSLIRTVRNIMNLFEGEVKKEYVFKNGEADGKTPDNTIQPINADARIRAADILSFEAVKNKKTRVLTVRLKEDDAKYDGKKTAAAKHNSRLLKTVKLQSLKTAPISVNSANKHFSGAQASLTLAANGKVKELTIQSGVTVDAACSVSVVDFSAKVGYTISETYSFRY